MGEGQKAWVKVTAHEIAPTFLGPSGRAACGRRSGPPMPGPTKIPRLNLCEARPTEGGPEGHGPHLTGPVAAG